MRTPLVRRQTGYDLDLDGFDTDTITLGDEVLFRNPYPGRRLNDEEIAIAPCWTDGGLGPRRRRRRRTRWPRAPQDHLIALAVEEAADTDRTVTVTAALEIWA